MCVCGFLFDLCSYFSCFFVCFCHTGKRITIRKKAVRNDWLIEIAKRHPVSLAMVQCYGDKLSENTLRELFKEVAPKLKVSTLLESRFVRRFVAKILAEELGMGMVGGSSRDVWRGVEEKRGPWNL